VFGIHDLPFFILSGLLLNMFPGPDSLLVMTRSASQGWRAGCAAALGIGCGTMLHIFCAAIGLSAVLATCAAFTAVKYLGAGYIIFTAISLLRTAPPGTSPAVIAPPLPYRRIVMQGFLTDALNPKGALFFISFVPQFIDGAAPNKPLAFLILGGIFNANGVLWYMALACFAAKARKHLQPSPLIARWLQRATAGLFVGIGIKLAFAKPQ
jgi:threonine/homoserine/homoserine lactone efflux protein